MMKSPTPQVAHGRTHHSHKRQTRRDPEILRSMAPPKSDQVPVLRANHSRRHVARDQMHSLVAREAKLSPLAAHALSGCPRAHPGCS